jgi:radial spoke head protein 4A
MSSTAELRQILKQDANGRNLYDHLTETLMKILVDRPANAFDMFEHISAEVKANPLNPETSAVAPVPPSADEINKQLQWARASGKLLKRPDEPPEENVKFPDLMDEANLLEQAGVSFGRSDTYRLYLSIKKLSETLPAEAERLRFFGRISTRGAPYYIVEGINPEDEENVEETKQEGRSGANKYAYWVTQDIEACVWTKLPNVTMAQVVTARKFKKLLTGNLDAAVPSYPPFPGRERHLLRTLIALIAGSTSISPAGFFEVEEDSDPPNVKLVEAEALNEAFPKAASELKELDAWVHHEIELNAIGRATAMPEQQDENGDPIEPEEPVDVTPPLKALDEDAWAFRLSPGGSGEHAGSAVVVKSLKWPGAIAVAAGRRFLNIYVGDGCPYAAETYTPPLPQAILKEWSPAEEEEPLVEQADVRTDPTPPKDPEAAEEGGEEEDEN